MQALLSARYEQLPHSRKYEEYNAISIYDQQPISMHCFEAGMATITISTISISTNYQELLK